MTCLKPPGVWPSLCSSDPGRVFHAAALPCTELLMENFLFTIYRWTTCGNRHVHVLPTTVVFFKVRNLDNIHLSSGGCDPDGWCRKGRGGGGAASGTARGADGSLQGEKRLQEESLRGLSPTSRAGSSWVLSSRKARPEFKEKQGSWIFMWKPSMFQCQQLAEFFKKCDPPSIHIYAVKEHWTYIMHEYMWCVYIYYYLYVHI